ncbi:unnamed protein product [Clonostachys rosea]|uniref:DUF7600 domain-containing protein n=1 Tax=Bionectria ochroleuca TaxID=29856 RepID=A0ABY6U6W1_BIOOC|nr:unnamed protein product [Clonostachys rosea]
MVPKNLNQVVVHLCPFGNTTYVVGLELVLDDNTSLEVGYQSPQKESVTLSLLKGLAIAADGKGLQALQFIDSGDKKTPWCGDPTGCPRTNRLASLENITELEFGFDGCKMVGIGVPRAELAASTDFVNSALWHPKIPGNGLFVNYDSLTPTNELMSAYRPIIWTHFGGPRGIYLRALTGIRVIYESRSGGYGGNILQMKYQYVHEGACKPGALEPLGRYEPRRHTGVEICFSVNGPGGDFINRVDMLYSHHDGFATCKLFTNWDRSCLFCPDPKKLSQGTWRTAKVKLGTTITDFYAEKAWGFPGGLRTFGVISEFVGVPEAGM